MAVMNSTWINSDRTLYIPKESMQLPIFCKLNSSDREIVILDFYDGPLFRPYIDGRSERLILNENVNEGDIISFGEYRLYLYN